MKSSHRPGSEQTTIPMGTRVSPASISAIILSAGSSHRMGRPKALLTVNGELFIGKIIREIAEASIVDCIAVLGSEHAPIHQAIDDGNVRVVINAAWQTGRLSSIVAGLGAVDRIRCEGVLIWPVDHPLVSARVIGRMKEIFEGARDRIIVPAFNSRRGHPVIIPRVFFEDVAAAPAEQGLRAVVHAHAADVVEVPTDEEGILINIDTPDEYARYCSG